MTPLTPAHQVPTTGFWLRDLLLLTVLFGFLFCYGLGDAPLIDPDEGRYAEIPREMLERGDLVTPTLNYVKYFEKPPLLYWVNAGSLQLFGKNEFAARLPSALAGLLTVLVTYGAGRLLMGRRTGLLAAFILGSCAGFLFQSRIILTDMLLTLCLSSALFSFALGVYGPEGRRKLFFRLFFVFCGLAVLAKGLIGIVLPAGILFWYLLLDRRWQLLADIPWFSGLLLFFAVTAPWFVLISLKNPEFPHFFFIREHFQRFTSTIHRRSQPVWFFLPILLLTMLPWSFLLPGSLAKAWRDRTGSRGSTLLLLIWPLVIILFFSLSSSKLIPYILPVFPPLALLVAHRAASGWHARHPDHTPAVVLVGSVLLIIGVALAVMPQLTWLPPFLQTTGQLGRELATMLTGPAPVITTATTVVPGSALAVTGLLFLVSLRARSTVLTVALFCCFGLLLDLLLPWAFARYGAERLSARTLAAAAQRHAGPESVLAQIGPRQGMGFYTGRRLVTVGDYDELAFGSQQGDQSAWFMTPDQFQKLWHSGRHVLLVAPRHQRGEFRLATSADAVVLADNGSLLLLSNR